MDEPVTFEGLEATARKLGAAMFNAGPHSILKVNSRGQWSRVWIATDTEVQCSRSTARGLFNRYTQNPDQPV